jgi:thiamine-phosphate pyrophosphorylase
LSDSLARRALARAAARLNLRGAALGKLPPLCLMTDDERLADPAAAAAALPRGSLVIVRSRNDRSRAALASQLARVAKARDLILLVASDPPLALRSKADGLHLPESRASEASHWRAIHPHWLITVSVHSLHTLGRIKDADAALLAPVFLTGSHPGRRSLTPLRANAIARLSRVPLYALGGITAVNAKRISGTNYAGLAAISSLSPTEHREAEDSTRRTRS